MIPLVSRTLHQEALPRCSAVAAKDPLSHHSPPPVVFPLPKFGFVDFDDMPSTTNLLCSTIVQEILCHALSKCLEVRTDCLCVEGEDPCHITDADSVAKQPKEVEECRQGKLPFVENATRSD